MARNESGEFEMVLGNRQLLSLAAIVVILFGVFFTMGFIVGRSSTPFPRAVESLPPSLAEGRPAPTGSRPAPVETAVTTPPAESTQPAQAPVADPTAGTDTQATPPPAETPPPVPAQSGESYLQVAAIARRDAEILVDTLRKKGFPALLSAGPNDLFRVLVGPYPDRDSLGKAKSDLEAAGFKNAFVPKL